MANSFSNLKEKVMGSKIAKACAACSAAVATFAVGAVQALASNIDDSMKSALTSAFTGIKDDVIALINIALPAALVIVGIGIAVTLGIKFFKKFAK